MEFNSTNCLGMQYKLLKGMYFDNIEETNDYTLCTSDVLDDYFWNIAYIKTKLNDNILLEIENKFKNINCIPSLYIGRDDTYYEDNKNFILNNNYKLNDTDVIMLLNDYKDTDINIDIKVVKNEKEYNDYMYSLASAYNDNIENPSENVYADSITKSYYDAIKNSLGSSKTFNIVGYKDNIPVSVATLNLVDGIGIINNVGTTQGYWNKGYSKQVLTYLIKLFRENGGNHLLLVTEHNSKNQTYYEKLGFKELYVMEQYMK